jgi:hypothetical protein
MVGEVLHDVFFHALHVADRALFHKFFHISLTFSLKKLFDSIISSLSTRVPS